MEYERRDYFKDRFTREELKDVLDRAGVKPNEVLSTRSRAYKSLGLAQRSVSEDELLDLMVQEPTLLRRPLIIAPAGTAVGFNQKRMQEITNAD